jgi:hypothetical protein
MLDGAPRPGASRLKLRFTPAHFGGLPRREGLAHIHQALGPHLDAPALDRHFHKVAFLKLQGLKDALGDDDLAPLANPAYGQWAGYCRC